MSSTAPGRSTEPPIVLIHGMWMTPLSWEHWAARYRERGHQVLAPAWPGLEGEPEEIRRDPSPLEGLSIPDVIDHYEQIIRELDAPPIIIGHSFGGLFAQLLLDRGLGSAGAALGTGAPKGVLRLPYSTIRAAWTALHNPLGKNNIAPLTPEQFHWCFTNSLSREDSDAVYERYYIPGSARPFFQAGYANFNPNAATKVDYRTRTGRRSSWSREPRTASAHLRSTRRTSRSRARRPRPPSTRSIRAAVTSPARTAGRRWRTTFLPGRPGTRAPQSRRRPRHAAEAHRRSDRPD